MSDGGSISLEHGDGQSKAEFLYKIYGPELVQAFREFKSLWDPDWKMNPGKIVDPSRIDQNLRLGANYHPWNHLRISISCTTAAALPKPRCARWERGSAC